MTTPTLTEARQALADALTAVDGVTLVVAHGVKAQLRPGHGWTRVLELAPTSFRTSNATLEAYIVLDLAEVTAEAQLDALAVPLLDAAATIETLPAFNITVEPAVMNIAQNQSLYVLVVTLTTEVQ